ncbi:MAG: Carbohydrate binding domain, partial [Actinomycetota bacterium]
MAASASASDRHDHDADIEGRTSRLRRRTAIALLLAAFVTAGGAALLGASGDEGGERLADSSSVERGASNSRPTDSAVGGSADSGDDPSTGSADAGDDAGTGAGAEQSAPPEASVVSDAPDTTQAAKAATPTTTPTAPAAVPSSTGPATATTQPGGVGGLSPDTGESVTLAAVTDGTFSPLRVLARHPSERAPGSGLIAVAGPGKLVLGGRYTVTNSGWSINVETVSGTLSGVSTRNSETAGTITFANGALVSTVSVDLQNHPQVVPAWNQTTTLTIAYSTDAQALTGSLEIEAAGRADSLQMSGPVVGDGYVLAGSGSVTWGGQVIEFSGEYVGAVEPGGRAHTWSFDGAAAGPVTFDDGRLDDVVVAMTETRPGLTGTGRLTFEGATPLQTDVTFDVEDDRYWTLTPVASAVPDVSSPVIDGLTLEPSGIDGTVKRLGGRVFWALGMPMSLVQDKVTISGMAVVNGPTSFELRANSAAGSILNSDTPALFEMVRGIIRFDDGRVLGTLRLVAASGPRLIDLPDDWAGVSDLRINFAGTKGGPVARAFDLTYNIINGGTRIVLEGSFSTQSQFELSVRGNLAFGEGKVPFGGTYRTAGVLVDGNPLLAPEWDIAGDIADAPGGNVPIGGGAALVGGRLTLVGSTTAAPVQIAGAELFKVASVTPTTVAANSGASGSDVGAQATTTTVTGSMTVQLSSNDTFTLQGTTVYVDEDDWTTTVIISDGEPWTPPGMVGLSIPLQNFSGTIVSVAGAVAWNVAISEVSWVNMTTGVSLVTDLSLGTDCPLTENCPEIEGVYAGFTNGALTFPDPVPDMTLDGAFLSDGSWARMDAVAGELTYNGIGISESAFTMWKGTRTDEFDPALEMPDLSAENNGFNLEFCGQFIVTVPDIKTFETGGCVTWTPDGVVMGQTKLGGSLSTSTSTEGVSIGSTGLTGWAWTDLPSLPKVGIGDIDLPLEEGLNQLAAGMTIPANIMKAAGQPDKDLVIPATGWFKSGDFWLEGEIPINLKGSGVTLDSILVQIGKEASTFTLGFGANGSIKMQGNEFPIEALVKLKVGGGNNEISISVSAKGTTTSDTRGTFDLPTLLAEGNFEPSNTSPLDGTFDGKKKEFLSNGGFENAKDAGNLLTNSDFETGALGELSVNGDFEDGASGNFLVNNDFEDDNIYINGDFEQNADYWFIDNSKFTVATVSDSAPEDSKGSVALQINNINGQLGAGNGLYQSLNIDARGDRAYVLSVWARSNDNTNGAMRLYLTQTGSSGCSSADQSDWTDFTVTPTWRLYQLRVIGNECRTGFIGYINPTAPGDSIVVDRAEFRATTNPVYNNDFEMGVSTGWNVEANYAAAAVANDGAPKETSGGYALRLTNNNPSGTGGQGMYQFVTSTLSGGQTYKMSVWARSNTSSNATMKLELLQRTTRSGCAASGDDVQNSTFTVTPEWKQYSFNVTGNACKGDLTVRVVPTVNTQSIVIDSMDIRGSSYNWIVINNQSLPIITNPINFDPPVSKAGTSVYRDLSIGDPAGSIRTDGNGEWWFLNSGTWPNLAGDQFDISYDLFFPNSGARDIFNFGFYLNAGSTAPNGYAFRVQSANGNNQDSGFYTVSNGNLGGRVAGDANWGPLARNTWYRIRLSGSGGNVNASVVRKSDSVEVWNKTVTLPGGNRSGVFGQIKDGAGAAEGVRIDNLTLYSTGNFDGFPRIADVPGSARTGDQYLVANPPDNTWEIMWPTGQAPELGKSYAVSAWVKSPSGNMSGELYIDVEGGAYEISDTNFTANGTWQKVTATLRVQQANHTDLRVGLRNLVKPVNGAEIQVDDMTVQELAGGWYPVPVPSWSNAVSVGITSDPGTAFAGSKAIAVASGQNTACGAYAEQVVNVVPTVGSTYTLTAQVKSNAAVAGQLTIQTIGGTFEGLGTTFTTTAGAWKPITVTLPINQSGHTGFLLSLCASQENMANPIYYDNLSFTAVNEPVVRPADEGWQASATTPFDTLPGLSKNGTVDIDNTVGNPAPSLRKVGLGAWKAYNTNGPFYGNGDFTAQYDAYFPAGSGRDIADFGFWVTGTVGTNITGYAFRLQTQEVDAGLWQITNNVFTRPAGVTTSFTPVATNTWYRVKLTAVGNNLTYEVRRISDNALYTQQTVTLSGGNRAGMFTEPYHGASSTTGHRYDNMQISVSGNSPAARIMSNPSTARSGNGALRITNNAGYSTTAMRRTPAITPASGYSYTFSAWVRAASGTVNGRISAGTASSNFTADTTWRQVTVTTTATSTAPITIGIENLQAGTTLYSDDWGFGQQGLTQP